MVGGVEAVVAAVLETLRKHVSEGEWQDIKSAMPKDFATALP